MAPFVTRSHISLSLRSLYSSVAILVVPLHLAGGVFYPLNLFIYYSDSYSPASRVRLLLLHGPISLMGH